MEVWVLSKARRRRRINELTDEVAHHERQMRNAVAKLIELTDLGDDLHVECRRLLEALDG
jgi:hypothetical protein